MFGIGIGEWVIIIVAVILLFGTKRIPEIARGLGCAVREFKKAKDDLTQGSDEAQRQTQTHEESIGKPDAG